MFEWLIYLVLKNFIRLEKFRLAYSENFASLETIWRLFASFFKFEMKFNGFCKNLN